MTDTYNEQTILAYVEGDLSPQQQHAFKLAMLTDAKLKKLVEQMIADRTALRQMPLEPVPVALAEYVDQYLERNMLLGPAQPGVPTRTQAERRFRITTTASLTAIAAVLMLGVGLLVWQTWDGMRAFETPAQFASTKSVTPPDAASAESTSPAIPDDRLAMAKQAPAPAPGSGLALDDEVSVPPARRANSIAAKAPAPAETPKRPEPSAITSQPAADEIDMPQTLAIESQPNPEFLASLGRALGQSTDEDTPTADRLAMAPVELPDRLDSPVAALESWSAKEGRARGPEPSADELPRDNLKAVRPTEAIAIADPVVPEAEEDTELEQRDLARETPGKELAAVIGQAETITPDQHEQVVTIQVEPEQAATPEPAVAAKSGAATVVAESIEATEQMAVDTTLAKADKEVLPSHAARAVRTPTPPRRPNDTEAMTFQGKGGLLLKTDAAKEADRGREPKLDFYRDPLPAGRQPKTVRMRVYTNDADRALVTLRRWAKRNRGTIRIERTSQKTGAAGGTGGEGSSAKDAAKSASPDSKRSRRPDPVPAKQLTLHVRAGQLRSLVTDLNRVGGQTARLLEVPMLTPMPDRSVVRDRRQGKMAATGQQRLGKSGWQVPAADRSIVLVNPMGLVQRPAAPMKVSVTIMLRDPRPERKSTGSTGDKPQ